MTNLYKHRLILDLDNTGGPIQCTIELHTLDGSSVHRITTWEPGPFDTIQGCVAEMVDEVHQRYGTQLELPL